MEYLRKENIPLKEQVKDAFNEIAQLKDIIKILYVKDSERQSEIEQLKNDVASLTEKYTSEMSKVGNLQKMLNRLHLNLQLKKDQAQEPQIVPLQPSCCASDVTTVGEGSVSSSMLQKQMEEKEKMKLKSHFLCKTSKLIPLLTGKPVFVDHYDIFTVVSENLDPMTGVYKIPLTGEYKFRGGMKIEGKGRVKYFLCSNKDSQRSLIFDMETENQWRYENIICIFEKDTMVWVELVREEGNAKALCTFSTILNE